MEKNIFRHLQTYTRRKRFRFIQRILVALPQPCYLLDVGGTQEFWEKMCYTNSPTAIILYNLTETSTDYDNIISIAGDARDMSEFMPQQFQFVFSNSVIEHVGSYQQQRQMAQEIQRVGQSYCVQTPNRYFPIEPHVLLPFFQFLPLKIQSFVLTYIPSPWGWKLSGRQEAAQYVRAIRLLNERELRKLFPGASIYKEKWFGLTKSFIVYKCT